MNSIELYFFTEHLKEAMSNDERNDIIDAAKTRANLGSLARYGVTSQTGPVGGFLPIATYASGYGVRDPELQDRIRETTMMSGSAGQLIGLTPGMIAMSRARHPEAFLAGALAAGTGAIGGELIGQRMGLESLKRHQGAHLKEASAAVNKLIKEFDAKGFGRADIGSFLHQKGYSSDEIARTGDRIARKLQGRQNARNIAVEKANLPGGGRKGMIGNKPIPRPHLSEKPLPSYPERSPGARLRRAEDAQSQRMQDRGVGEVSAIGRAFDNQRKLNKGSYLSTANV